VVAKQPRRTVAPVSVGALTASAVDLVKKVMRIFMHVFGTQRGSAAWGYTFSSHFYIQQIAIEDRPWR
jgi:hypothetical protein